MTERMPDEYRGRYMVRHIGRCIYCGIGPDKAKLTNEHIVPFSLGADAYLKEASCSTCQKITRDFETHLARNVFGQLRIHIGIQTRNPGQRPTELPTRIVRGDKETRVTLPIKDHPNFLPMPIWETPGILRGEQPHSGFTGLVAHLFYYVPPTLGEAIGMRHAEAVQLLPDFRVETDRFARAIAKIAYCQAVARLGLDGFRRLALPDLILGKYTGISYFVGSALEMPPPPEPRGRQHRIDLSDVWWTERLRLLIASVRLFGDSGTAEHGLPVYTVVVGVPITPQTPYSDAPLMTKSADCCPQSWHRSRAAQSIAVVPAPW
jgi:hypothetical protein